MIHIQQGRTIPYRLMSLTKVTLIASLSLLTSVSFAGNHHQIENPKNLSADGVYKDTWILKYQADDFSDDISNATLLFIPQDYRTEKAYLLRCKDYFANVSVKYIDHEKSLKTPGGALPNASKSFAKHGYVYDTKQSLKVTANDETESYNVSVGGQNRALSKLFKTDIKKEPGMLGMSFHFSFTYREMPAFKADKNSSDTRYFYKQLVTALKNDENIHFDLENDLGHRHQFTLDIKRLNKFVPPEVMEYCFTKRELR